MSIIPTSVILKLVKLSDCEIKLEELISRGERLLGTFAPALDESAYNNTYAQACDLLESYGNGRFAPYFRQRFEKLSKKEEEVFK